MNNSIQEINDLNGITVSIFNKIKTLSEKVSNLEDIIKDLHRIIEKQEDMMEESKSAKMVYLAEDRVKCIERINAHQIETIGNLVRERKTYKAKEKLIEELYKTIDQLKSKLGNNK